MTFLIRFIKNFEFVGKETFTGTLDAAAKFASDGLKKCDADTAAVMDEVDSKGEPKALLSRDA